MRQLAAVWRASWRLWLPALVFFLVNASALLLYRAAYAGRVDQLNGQLSAREQERTRLESQRAALAALELRAEANQARLTELYEERFGSEQARFTSLIAEVKELAARSGLDPQSISYPEEVLKDHGLVRRSFVFGVQGTYTALRQFLYLLELSPSFLSVDQISVGDTGAQSARLSIDLRLSTLFRPPGVGSKQPGEGSSG